MLYHDNWPLETNLSWMGAQWPRPPSPRQWSTGEASEFEFRPQRKHACPRQWEDSGDEDGWWSAEPGLVQFDFASILKLVAGLFWHWRVDKRSAGTFQLVLILENLYYMSFSTHCCRNLKDILNRCATVWTVWQWQMTPCYSTTPILLSGICTVFSKFVFVNFYKNRCTWRVK